MRSAVPRILDLEITQYLEPPMIIAYPLIRAFVQQLTPTWRKTQQENLAQVVAAILERPSLCLSELARAMPRPDQPLHGRLKRIDRFLDNPRLDEPTLFVRWLKLSYRFGEDVPHSDHGRPIIPLLLDTTYFEPFAMLLTTVPCGSRGLPIALTTYHRYQLQACFPPRPLWPSPLEQVVPPLAQSGHPLPKASAVPCSFLSQNKIEEELIDYVFTLLSPALRGVLVADRGFARASLFQGLQAQKRDFDIRIDAQTHIRLPAPLAPNRPTEGPPAAVLGLQPGQRLWCPQAWYSQEEQVPIRLLAVWDADQKEPWYLANSMETAEQAELLYRWRMRLECTNRDEKTGVLLREGGDEHAIISLLHLHRLLLALCTAEWLCALSGLQGWHDLPLMESLSTPSAATLPPLPPSTASDSCPPVVPESEPAMPAVPLPAQAAQHNNRDNPEPLHDGPDFVPAVIAHRGDRPKLPSWMRRFAARGPLSYVRLGLEILRSPDLLHIAQRLVRWLAAYLSIWNPPWNRRQIRYRLKHWCRPFG
jgi:hypothetical protein